MRFLKAAFLALVMGAAIAAGAFGPPAKAQTVAPSLEGEAFANLAQEEFISSCDPSGNSTISFRYEGTAVGPYPGNAIESGVLTIGPQTQPSTTGGPSTGEILLLHTSFTIDSLTGQVSGTKDLSTPLGEPNTGICLTTGPSPELDEFCASIGIGNVTGGTSKTVQEADASLAYQATIQTTDGAFQDSGLASLRLLVIEELCANSLVGQTHAWSDLFFNETFDLSNGVLVLTTPGQANGGGQIDHVPPGNAGAVIFGFTAYSTDRGIRATCDVIEGTVHVRCLDATTYSQLGTSATFSGAATVNGVPTTYTINVQDNAKPGVAADTFMITTSSGYTASGTVTQGDIQVSS
jgi:hypothetical protein